MALVGKPSRRSNPGQAVPGVTQQLLCPLDPALHRVAVRPYADRLLEGTAEVGRAEAGNPCQLCQVKGTVIK